MLGRKFSNELNVNIRTLHEIIRSNHINEDIKKKLIYKNILSKININEQTPNSKYISEQQK